MQPVRVRAKHAQQGHIRTKPIRVPVQFALREHIPAQQARPLQLFAALVLPDICVVRVVPVTKSALLAHTARQVVKSR
jgi:hypothetical protein